MGKSSETFSKKEKEKKRQKKKEAKAQRKEARQANSSGGALDAMMAYVDEFGNIVDTPPDPNKKKEVDLDSIQLGAASRDTVDETEVIRKGRVDYYNDDKGYGFIKEYETNERYFVHVNGMIDRIGLNDKVTFTLEQGPKGMNAVEVRRDL
ncbi:MAG: cold shock domain-containing protein [Bacteroidota bacterium]